MRAKRSVCVPGQNYRSAMTRKMLLALGVLLVAASVDSANLMELIASTPTLSKVRHLNGHCGATCHVFAGSGVTCMQP